MATRRAANFSILFIFSKKIADILFGGGDFKIDKKKKKVPSQHKYCHPGAQSETTFLRVALSIIHMHFV